MTAATRAARKAARTASQAPIKISSKAKEKLRLAAAIAGTTQAELVEEALDEYLVRHADELEKGLQHARTALSEGIEEAVAYALDEDVARVKRVAGSGSRAEGSRSRAKTHA